MKLRPLAGQPEPHILKLHQAFSEALDYIADKYPEIYINYASVDAMGRSRIILHFIYERISYSGELDLREEVQNLSTEDLRQHIIDRILTAIGEI